MIKEFDTEEEMDAEFEKIEEINHEHMRMLEDLEKAKKNVEYHEDMLKEFEGCYEDYLIK